MFVKRMKLYGVRGFRFDLPLSGEGDLPLATRKRLLLQGGNGSGKTTLLETIAGLWEWFGKMIDDSIPAFRFPQSSPWNSELSAMELGDFPVGNRSMWIAVGSLNGIDALKKSYPDTPLACVQRSSSDYRIELPPGDWPTVKLRSQEGVEPLPNVVYFPPEGRRPMESNKEIKRLDLYQHNWMARFNTKEDLDSLLFTVRARNPERYDEALNLFNQMLLPSGKRIARLDGRQVRVQIERIEEPRPPAHSWTALSSGERQMLVLVVYTVCLLRERSILIIDEPDLHIHIAMVTQLMEALEKVVRDRHGQLIVASHSQMVWDWFARDEERIQLGRWKGENS